MDNYLCQRLNRMLGFALSTVFSMQGIAQEKAPVQFGKVQKEDFTIQSTLVGDNTSGVIIADIGNISFEGNTNGWFSYVFKRKKRVKIIDKKAFDLATVSILLYKSTEMEEQVLDINAVTYNLENGKVVETRLAEKDVFTEKEDKNHFNKKFTLPNLREGSILEYSYTVKSDYIFNLPAWQFQHQSYPCLWSEFNVAMPGLLSYMSFFQGYNKFFIHKSSDAFQHFSVRRKRAVGGGLVADQEETISVSSPVTKNRWVIKDLQPFRNENFIASPKNLMDKISFQLYKTYDGEKFHDVANNWKAVTNTLLKREDFGLPLTENTGWLDYILEQVTNSADTGLEAARKIYYFIQKNYTCTNRYDKYIRTNLQDVVKNKSGSVGDINLLMTAMLKRKGLRAAPVLMSTREFGRNSERYPELERINYVIAQVKIGSLEYFLDGTVPYLPFGALPANCYNGHARVIADDTVALDFDPGRLKESSVVSMHLQVDDKNRWNAFYNTKLGLYKSMEAKEAMGKSVEDYKSGISKGFPEEFIVEKTSIDSLIREEDLISTRVDLRAKAFDADIIYFNPMMNAALKTNPLPASQRLNPVELPYTTDDTYVLNLEIPKGYKAEEIPKSARISFNKDEGMFEYIIQADAARISLMCRTKINRAFFSSEDYEPLRDFYGYIVMKQAEQIVFKKIK